MDQLQTFKFYHKITLTLCIHIYIQFIVIIMLQSLFNFYTLPYVLISNLTTFYNYSFKFVNIDNFVELCTCG